MLDVHPPEHAAHSWRDFFIHIATIVIGLLIAIGLEQTVEYLHHRHLAHQARLHLLDERRKDQISNDVNIYCTEHHELYLRRDLAILHAMRDHAPVPQGQFILEHPSYMYMSDEWRKIHQNGTVAYLDENLSPTDYRYENQDAFLALSRRSDEDLYRAAAVLRSENDAAMKTAEANVARSTFLKKLAENPEAVPEADVEKFFSGGAASGNLATLSPAEIDGLGHAIQVALADDDMLLGYCFNIKRNLHNNPANDH
jgi:hypothetical protein